MDVESAQKLLDDGRPVAALKAVAALMQDTPGEPACFDIGSRALFTAIRDLDALHAWDEAERHALYRALLHHTPCPTAMLTFAHEAASNLTSGNQDAVRLVTDELAPVLTAELAIEAPDPVRFKNVLVFVLTVRAVAGSWLSQATVSRLHLEWFTTFTPDDLALPYSVMFNPDLFGQNRAELLAAHWPVSGELPPDTVLFLSWLAGEDPFDHDADLTAYLNRHLPGTTTDRAAAKTLLLRSATKDMTGRFADWNIDDLTALLKSVADRRLPKSADATYRIGARFLQTKPYQAINAAVHQYAPFLTGFRKPRVAICLSGQLRGYEHALTTWRKTILNGIEPVFFIHSWHGIGRSDAQPFRYVLPFEGKAFPEAYRQIALRQGYDAMRARYPALFDALAAGNQADPDALASAYNTDHIVLEDDKGAKFADFSNQQKMHYKIHAADQLARQSDEFDLHMRLRPDLEMALVGFQWSDLLSACQSHPGIFAEKPYGLHYNNLMIGDQCAVGTPAAMRIYTDTWVNFSQFGAAGLGRCPTAFTGHVSLAMNAWLHGLNVARLPIRFGKLVDAAPLGGADILAALQLDNRDDADDHQLMKAARTDMATAP